MIEMISGQYEIKTDKLCSSEGRKVPEVLDVVLHSREVQAVGQSLVVHPRLSRGAPVHIWKVRNKIKIVINTPGSPQVHHIYVVST